VRRVVKVAAAVTLLAGGSVAAIGATTADVRATCSANPSVTQGATVQSFRVTCSVPMPTPVTVTQTATTTQTVTATVTADPTTSAPYTATPTATATATPTSSPTAPSTLVGGPGESGILPGSTLTLRSGDVWLNTNGATLSNAHVTGSVYITASNVTVSNVQVDGGIEVNLTPGRSRVTPVPANVVLRRVDTDWIGAGGFAGLTVDRSEIHDAQNASHVQLFNDAYNGTAYPASKLTFTTNWVHGFLQRTNGAHEENLHIAGIQGALIQGNLFEMYPAPGSGTDGYTANLMSEPVFQGVYNRDVTVDGNVFHGGSYYQAYLNGLGANVLTGNAFHSDSPIFGGVLFPWSSYSAGTTPSGGWPAWSTSGNTLDGKPFTPSFG
jgi:hypothetical protein